MSLEVCWSSRLLLRVWRLLACISGAHANRALASENVSVSRSRPHVFLLHSSLLSSSLSLCFVPLMVRRVGVALGACWTCPHCFYHAPLGFCTLLELTLFKLWFFLCDPVPPRLRSDDMNLLITAAQLVLTLVFGSQPTTTGRLSTTFLF